MASSQRPSWQEQTVMDPASTVAHAHRADHHSHSIDLERSPRSALRRLETTWEANDAGEARGSPSSHVAPSLHDDYLPRPQLRNHRSSLRGRTTSDAPEASATTSATGSSGETLAHVSPVEALEHVVARSSEKKGDTEGDPEKQPEKTQAELADEEEVQRIMERMVSGKTKGWRMRVMRFTASWFSVTMGTGIINTLLFLLPWESTHRAFAVIGLIFLIFDACLFIAFSIMTAARYMIYPEIFMIMMRHEVHSLFLGAIPMGFVTIVNGIAFQGHYWKVRGPVVQVASGLWWLAGAMSLFTALSVPWMMMTKQNHRTEALTAAWLLPVVPPLTVAAAGSTIAELLRQEGHTEYAFTIVITSYILNGLGLWISILLLAIYLMRLAVHHLPDSQMIVTTFLPLGPCGQGGFALVQLGRVSLNLFPTIGQSSGSNDGRRALEVLGAGMYATGLVWGLLLWGLGMWWFGLALLSLKARWYKKSVIFNMAWWSLTFPAGSLCLLTYALGSTLSSRFFNVIGTIITAGIVICWLIVFPPTVKGAIRGSLFASPCLAALPPSVILRGIRSGKIRKGDVEA